MFAKQIESQEVSKVERDYKGSVEDYKNGCGYTEMANINLSMAQADFQRENEAENTLMSFIGE